MNRILQLNIAGPEHTTEEEEHIFEEMISGRGWTLRSRECQRLLNHKGEPRGIITKMHFEETPIKNGRNTG